MFFNSYIFVLLFFPLTALFYLCVYKKGKSAKVSQIILILSSLMFYLYAGWFHFVVLVFLGLTNFSFGKLIIFLDSKTRIRKIVLGLGIVVNLGILSYYKYYNFFIDNINLLLGTQFRIKEVIMPLGVSFITFQNIAFLVDIYRKDITKCQIMDYTFYISYFPKLLSGPITLFGDLRQFVKNKSDIEFWENIASGFYMFVMGMGKKVLLADMLAKVVDEGYACVGELNMPTALLVSLAYTFQIYFDFSGYSDMAIGISRIFQIKLADNFDSPYKAKTIDEFWDRWHMSLTRFFTKYLYIPLGGSRKGNKRTYLNIVIVFLCSGLWHGASWTFLIWGGMHGLAMVITKRFKNLFNKLPGIINQVITFGFVSFAWVVFRAGDFHTLKAMWRALFMGGWGKLLPDVCANFKFSWLELLLNVSLPDWVRVAIFLGAIGLMVFRCYNVKEKADEKRFTIWNIIWVWGVFIGCLLSFSHVTSYVYARF